MRSIRFRCPRCDVPLTPRLRALELMEALCLQGDQTWLLPAGWFVRRDDPRLASPYLATALADYPWLLAPLPSRWIRVHPDPARTTGCCGLNWWGPDKPNLVCRCGHEIGFGHGDCIGPHWYSLHASTVREEAIAETAPPDYAGRLARARELVAAPITSPPHDPGGRPAMADDVPSWDRALHLAELELTCGGGIEDPSLMIASPQLPAEARLVVPIPWCQLVRQLVLAEKPWAENELPLGWKSPRQDAPQVELSRHRQRVLMTVWGPGRSEWAVTMRPSTWADAWARLRGEDGESVELDATDR
ncbi:hypothetical protein OV090_16370 [Nannocystis sp. RBIL2]|uniref:hypothetical protein n=1 Tax=Nannocystis sp. RBIL2 TaxID=2996788 RepID=UPI002271AFCF|nr:hypothetical protein [Nannocystis sp. RBIL2]MCY1066356.1 hypothetical protein [Nannocystis sp. RBIL2]